MVDVFSTVYILNWILALKNQNCYFVPTNNILRIDHITLLHETFFHQTQVMSQDHSVWLKKWVSKWAKLMKSLNPMKLCLSIPTMLLDQALGYSEQSMSGKRLCKISKWSDNGKIGYWQTELRSFAFKWLLVLIMACCLFGIKPLSKPMLGYCQLDP